MKKKTPCSTWQNLPEVWFWKMLHVQSIIKERSNMKISLCWKHFPCWIKKPLVISYSDQLYNNYHILIQFWFGYIPVNGGGQIYPTLPAISPTPTFSKPTLKIALLFHLRLPRLLWSSSLPLALHSNSNTFLNTCLYHLTPFAFAIWTSFLHHLH